jgi:hypothetical protein
VIYSDSRILQDFSNMRLLGKLLARFSKRWARVSQQMGQIELEMAMEESGQLPKRQMSNLQVSILWTAIIVLGCLLWILITMCA